MPMGCCVRFRLLPAVWKSSAGNSSSAMAVMKCLGENRVGVHAEGVHPDLNLSSMTRHLPCCSASLDIM